MRNSTIDLRLDYALDCRGSVYKYFFLQETGQEFAAKVFSIQGMKRDDYVTERELSLLGKLKGCTHENIVKVIEIEKEVIIMHVSSSNDVLSIKIDLTDYSLWSRRNTTKYNFVIGFKINKKQFRVVEY